MMKRLLCALLALMLLTPAALCESTFAPLPFGPEDVQAAFNVPEQTVADFSASYAPESYGWWHETDGTVIVLYCAGGLLQIKTADASALLDPLKGLTGASDLPDEVLSLEAAPSAVYWDAPGFPLPTVRGVQIGDARETLFSLFPQADAVCQPVLEDEGSAFEETVSFSYDAVSDGGVPQRYTLTFYMELDAVAAMRLVCERADDAAQG